MQDSSLFDASIMKQTDEPLTEGCAVCRETERWKSAKTVTLVFTIGTAQKVNGDNLSQQERKE